MGPMERYLQWFDSQPVEVRQYLAFEASAMFPGDLLQKGTIDESVSEFRATLPNLVNGPLKEAGLILILSTFTTFAMQGRATQDDWTRTETMNRSIAAQMRAEGKSHLAEHVQDAAEKMEFRAKLWQRAAASWNEVRDQWFTLEALHQWLRGALADSLR